MQGPNVNKKSDKKSVRHKSSKKLKTSARNVNKSVRRGEH